ncbi:MAG: hypothetical protein GF307_10900 [candidate division Zixibacteria bacterium]|nr:hypothetical protein [candidate division Zixibacteria bacterium]
MMNSGKINKLKLQTMLEKVEEHLKALAQYELDRRGVFAIIQRLTSIIGAQEKEYWVLEDRFAELENWLKADAPELLNAGLDMPTLQRVVDELEKLKGFSNARWTRDSDEKSLKLRKLWETNISMAQTFLRKAARKLNLEYTPLGLVESASSGVKLQDSKPIIDSIRNEYLQLIRYQEEMLTNFYEPSLTMVGILDNEIKNLKQSGRARDEFFAANLLYFLKLKEYSVQPYVQKFQDYVKERGSKKVNV